MKARTGIWKDSLGNPASFVHESLVPQSWGTVIKSAGRFSGGTFLETYWAVDRKERTTYSPICVQEIISATTSTSDTDPTVVPTTTTTTTENPQGIFMPEFLESDLVKWFLMV